MNKEIIGSIIADTNTYDVNIVLNEEKSSEAMLAALVYFKQLIGGIPTISVVQIMSISTQNELLGGGQFNSMLAAQLDVPGITAEQDVRLITGKIQQSFNCLNGMPVQLSNSPATGSEVYKLTQEVIDEILEAGGYDKKFLSYFGNTSCGVNIPFMFKQFKKTGNNPFSNSGAIHGGVFGKTGSGKTTAAGFMIGGWLKNKDMNHLFYDPQGQFTTDIDIVHDDSYDSFEEFIKDKHLRMSSVSVDSEFLGRLNNIYSSPYSVEPKENMVNSYLKLNLSHISLDPDDLDLVLDLMEASSVIRMISKITAHDSRNSFRDSMHHYFEGRANNPKTNWANSNTKDFIIAMINRMLDSESTYIRTVFSNAARKNQLIEDLRMTQNSLQNEEFQALISAWNSVASYFSNNNNKLTVNSLANLVVFGKGNFIIFNPKMGGVPLSKSDDMSARILTMLQKEVQIVAHQRNEEGEKSNVMIYIDEAHRYMSGELNGRMGELCSILIDALKTSRKYGVGFLAISQTIRSLHRDIIGNLRFYCFGYGLNDSDEISTLKRFVSDEEAIKRYRHLQDPQSSGKYTFMITGPISPFIGISPVFLDVYNNFTAFH